MSTSSSSCTVERTVELQPLPLSPIPATDVIDLTGSPKTRPHPPVTVEDWTCGFCEVHFSSRMECDAHLSDIHLLSQEKVELSPPSNAKHDELPKSPTLRDSPPVPTPVEPDNALFNIFDQFLCRIVPQTGFAMLKHTSGPKSVWGHILSKLMVFSGSTLE
ncbi:hypothetical protein JTE90_022573 [Oedothorax gibbosus]|uniref:C2H2-type domain-containing protein n=1 Tax=Oedothorax gibbosus TaxID=931172 RepID=A0AAV6TEL3_9ARAC|nr:hypothetical protein JTE90_022573 [Oedothorax gibbosus]